MLTIAAACLQFSAAAGTVDGIQDLAGNYVSNVPFTSGETYIYAPNAAPTDIQLSNTTIGQSSGVNAVVGMLTTTDMDAADSHTYSLVSGAGGTDNSLFNISGAVLRANNALAMRSGEYSVRVRTDDGQGGIYEEALWVVVLNDVAPIAAVDSYSTSEDVVLNVSAPGVLANDTDAANTNLAAVLVTLPTHGSVSLNPNGGFVYTPNTNFHGEDSFSYRANDGSLDSAPATVWLMVNSVNDVPVATTDFYSATEDTLLTVSAPGILVNDLDADGETIVPVVVTTTTHGTLNLSPDGSFTYLPNTNFFGEDSFTYALNDISSQSAPATVSIYVSPVNDAPIAEDDTYNTDEDTVLVVQAPGVLGNDSDVDNSTLFPEVTVQPTHGSVVLNVDGSFSYTPETNFHGVDTFTYRVVDQTIFVKSGSKPKTFLPPLEDTAVVTINVNSVNDIPVAAAGNYTISEDQTLTITAPGILGGASDADGDTMTAVVGTNPAHGTLNLNSDGSFTYLPNTNYNGPDSFTYRISDGSTTLSDPATIDLIVYAVNDTPLAAADSFSTDEDVALTVGVPGVLINDSDIDGDLLTVEVVTQPLHGILDLHSDGSFIYTPETNYHGSDSFTYRAVDQTPAKDKSNPKYRPIALSDVATVTLTINSVNDAPIAANDEFTVTEDVSFTLAAPGVLSNDSDVEGDVLNASVASGPSHGTLTLNGDGSFTYLANTNYNGPDSFTYVVNDGLASSAPATVALTVTAVNDAPLAQAKSYTWIEDLIMQIPAPGVLAEDIDVEGSPLTAVLVSSPTNGTLVLNPDGSFTYTANTNYNGPDSFSYQASDGVLLSAVTTVSLTIIPINDLPLSANDTYTIDEDNTLTVSAPGVLSNDSDVESDPMTAQLVSGPSHGELTLNPDGSFVYTPETNYHGSDSFVYKAMDQGLGKSKTKGGIINYVETTATVTLTINPVNDTPMVADAPFTTDEDMQLSVAAPGVLATASDVDGDALTAVLVTGTSHGALTLNPDGSFTYLAATNWFGTDTFTFQANDGVTSSVPATVTITVNPVDDPPVVIANSGFHVLPFSSRPILSNTLQVIDVETASEGLVYTITQAPRRGHLQFRGEELSAGATFTQADIDSGRIAYISPGDATTKDRFEFSIAATDGGTVPVCSFLIRVDRIEREVEAVAGNFSISANGRYVAFQSTADNLVANDTNGVADIFVQDRYTGEITLVSAATDSSSANGASDWPRISADGRFVAYHSAANNLVGDDTNNKMDVFVYDRVTRQTVRVSVSSSGTQGNIDSSNPAISADGRYVAYHSTANNLVSGDTANQTDVFVHDMQTHQTERVSVATDGTQGDNASTFAAISADGRFVAFQSNARNLVSGDSNNSTDVFVHDRQLHVTARISLASDGTQGNNSSLFPSISDDGRYVAFQANASNLVPNDTNNTTDVFLHDRQTAQTIRVSVSSTGVAGNGASNDPRISNDGHYIVFPSLANNLVSGDTNAVSDIFVYDRLTARTVRVSTSAAGVQGDAASTKPMISAGGRFVAFLSRASNLLPGANGLDEIYMVSFNDQPTISPIDNITIDEDGVTAPIPFLVGDVLSGPDSLTIMATSSDTTLVPANSIVLSGTGSERSLQIAPGTNANGSATITVVVTDGSLSATNSFVLTVNPVNDAPIAVADSATTAEDTLLIVAAPGVLANDSDTENSVLAAVLVTEPAHGSLTLNADGSYSYLPETNWFGSDSFSYLVNDGDSNSAPVTVSITVQSVNDAPIAAAQVITTSEDNAVSITLAGSDVDADPLSFTVVSQPAHGSLSGTLPNLVYTPAADFNGEDSFSFLVNDGTADSAPATISLVVTPVNDAPIASAQTLTLNEDTTLAITLSATDVDGNPLSYTVVSGPAHGTLSGELPNLTYSPATNFNGSDSFTFVANDGTVDSAAVTVSLTVNSVNDAPIADAQSVTVDEDATVAITLSGSDVDHDSLTYTVTSQPEHGTLSGTAPNFVYAPATNYHGADSFTFTVNDGQVDSASATVAISVVAVNDQPVTGDLTIVLAEDTSTNLVLSASDVDADLLTYAIVDAPTNGVLDLTSLTNGVVVYTPATNYNGADAFTFSISDGFLSVTGAVALSVTPVNDQPIANALALTGDEDNTVEITLTASDVDGDTLAYTVASQPEHGTLNGTAPNLVYLPGTNFHGSDSFTFTVNDGSTDSAPATVSITVNSVNDLPMISAQQTAVDEDGSVEITLTGSDVDGDVLAFQVTVAPTHGVLTGEGSHLVYAPAANYHGSDSFSYVANDGTGSSAAETVSITVNSVNDVPVADSQIVSLSEDVATAITLAANDVDGDTLTFSVVTAPAHGTLTGTAPNLVYTPATNYFGEDSFTFTVNDGTASSVAATVSLIVSPVNDAPIAGADSYSTDEEQPLTIAAPGVLANDHDVEGSPLTAMLASTTSHGSLTLSANGSFTYRPSHDFFGVDTFTYRVNDGALESALATVSITVGQVPDAPIATNDVYTLDEDTTLVIAAPGVITNDFDGDLDLLTAVLVVGPSHGTLDLREDGGFTYTPFTNWFGTDSFSYLANDGLMDSEPVDILLVVNSVNDTPIATTESYNVDEDNLLTVPATSGVLANDSDVETEILTAVLASAPTHGKVKLNEDGSFSYAPAENYHGADAFTYQASDGTNLSAATEVTITVNPVNDAPIAAAPITATEGVYGTSYSFAFAADAFMDVDGDTLAYNASGLPAGLTFDAATRTIAGVPTKAGSYTVTIVAGDSALAATNSFSLTIAKAPLTITAADKSRAYGKANPELTFAGSGFVLSDDISVIDTLPAISTAADASSPVGSYTIALTGGSDDNYEITLASGSLAVTKGTVIAKAQDKSRVYGATNPELTIGYSGFENGEDFSVLDTLPTASTAATPASDVGSYPIVVSGGSDANYEIVLTNGTLTVTKATVIAIADNQHRAYGQTNPVLTISYAGFVNGETNDVLDVLPTATTDADTNSPVGEYVITMSGGSDANYDITLTNGVLVVGKATVVAIAHDASRVYGATNPVFTIEYQGLKNGEAESVLDTLPTASTEANEASPVGSYAITLSAASDSNYDIQLTNGVLTVTKSAITVTGNNASRTYGQANPEFTGSVAGAVASDNISATYDSVAGLSSPAGTYPIVPALVDPNGRAANYEVTLVNGTLTVTADDPPVITIDGSALYYVISNPEIFIDTNAVVSDGGSLNFDGGALMVSVATNGAALDRLALSTNEVITLEGSTVSIEGVAIATVEGGEGTNELFFTFNAAATPARVQALVRQVTFLTDDTNTTSRVIRFDLADGDGGVALPAFRTFALNRPPVAGEDRVLAAENITATIPFSLVLSNDFDVDSDVFTIEGLSVVSAHGGRVTIVGTNFVYRPPTNFVGEDAFAYLIDDGRQGEGVGIVSLRVLAKNRVVVDRTPVEGSEGEVKTKVLMGGTPSLTYQIMVSEDLITWSSLGITTANPSGVIEMLDAAAPGCPKRFYRAMLVH